METLSRQSLMDQEQPVVGHDEMMAGLYREADLATNQRIAFEQQALEAGRKETLAKRAIELGGIATRMAYHEEGGEGPMSQEVSSMTAEGFTSKDVVNEMTELYSSLNTESQSKKASSSLEAIELGVDKQPDAVLQDARKTYTETLKTGRGIRKATREARLADRKNAENAYSEALQLKIQAVLKDPSDYPPHVVEALQKENPTQEELKGAHLHIVVDQLSKEQVERTKALIEAPTTGVRKVFQSLVKNKVLRTAVAGALWAGSLVGNFGGVASAGMEKTVQALDKILPLIAGYATASEVGQGISAGFDKIVQMKSLKKNIDTLANSAFVGDALRTVYGATFYQDGKIMNRQAGDSQSEHKKALSQVDNELSVIGEHLKGGKSYGSTEIMPMVKDLYIDRKDQIDSLLESGNPAEAVAELTKSIINAQIEEFSADKLDKSKRKVAIKAIAIASSVIANEWLHKLKDVRETTGISRHIMSHGSIA